jgi:hypothetical protein
MADLDRDRGRWFADHGPAAFQRFVAEARRHAEVATLELESESRTVEDRLGPRWNANAALAIALVNGVEMFAAGASIASTRAWSRTVAIAECVERLGYALARQRALPSSILEVERPRPARLPDSSNGCSLHSSAIRAVYGAICELLERDALLANWYSDVPLPARPISAPHPLERQARLLAVRGWDAREHHWVHDILGAHCVAISLVRRTPRHSQWNFFLGSAARIEYHEATECAFAEALRQFRAYQGEFRVDTTSRIAYDRLDSPVARTVLFQRPRFVRTFLARLGDPPTSSTRSMRVSMVELVRRSFVALPTLRLSRLPVPASLANHVYCVQGSCDELQNLDWRRVPRYNARRIGSRHGTGRSKFCTIPHPLG